MPIARPRAGFLLPFLALALLTLDCSGSAQAPAVPADDAAPAAAADAPADPGPESDAGAAQAPAAVAPPAAAEFRPQEASGAVEGVPAATNTAPIVAVANYFTELPGFDVAGLKQRQRERFLQHVNSEMCPCGCKNDTLARCYVNDPRCPIVKGMVQKVYDEVKAAR